MRTHRADRPRIGRIQGTESKRAAIINAAIGAVVLLAIIGFIRRYEKSMYYPVVDAFAAISADSTVQPKRPA
jgi:hypothetical protein